MRPPATPSKNVRGLTDTEFDGLGTPDLRAWLDYWLDERRSGAEADANGIDRPTMIARLQAEIDARFADGTARKPARAD